MKIKTIHIKNFIQVNHNNKFNSADIPKLKNLIIELYDYTLKDDPKFHFFFEPEIIIRISDTECLRKVKEFLNNKNIDFEEYDYPNASMGKFGEDINGIVVKNLDLFLSIFHSNSVKAIKMSEEEYIEYRNKLIHTVLNPRYVSYQNEIEELETYIKTLRKIIN